MRSRKQTAEWLRHIGSTPVSVFPELETSVAREDNLQVRCDVYGRALNDSDDMTLDEALIPTRTQCDIIKEIRKARNKDKAALLRRTRLPEICISATLTSRIQGISEERRILRYNSLVVLNIAAEGDADMVKLLLSSLPFIFYAGLDTPGTGLDVIVPVETDDWRRHGEYFYAVKESIELLGLKVSSSGASVCSTISASYDAEAYRNNSCQVFRLPKGESAATPNPIPRQAADIQSRPPLKLYS